MKENKVSHVKIFRQVLLFSYEPQMINFERCLEIKDCPCLLLKTIVI